MIIKCPKCGSVDIDFYVLTATFHSDDTKIGGCKNCGYQITLADKHKQIEKNLKREEIK